MIALVPVRAGEPAAGYEEAVVDCGGRAIVAGEGAREAAGLVAEAGFGGEGIRFAELGPFAPGSWAERLGALLSAEAAGGAAGTIVLPGSPDGRDLAPRLAFVLRRPYVGAALEVSERSAVVVRRGGRQNVRLRLGGPFVATLLPRPRRRHRAAPGAVTGSSGSRRSPAPTGPEACQVPEVGPGGVSDPVRLELLEEEPSAVDLTEAERVLCGGGGLGGEDEFALLGRVGSLLGAAVGGTRVVTDAGLLPPDRQIGTTGASIRPRCYVALGISGAAQHLGGVSADRVVAVNLDPSCPMMSVADLALVTDAPALLRELDARLASGTEACER